MRETGEHGSPLYNHFADYAPNRNQGYTLQNHSERQKIPVDKRNLITLCTRQG